MTILGGCSAFNSQWLENCLYWRGITTQRVRDAGLRIPDVGNQLWVARVPALRCLGGSGSESNR